jgi:hypothetical protein
MDREEVLIIYALTQMRINRIIQKALKRLKEKESSGCNGNEGEKEMPEKPVEEEPGTGDAEDPENHDDFHFPDLLDVYEGLYGDMFRINVEGGEDYKRGVFWRHINIADWPEKVFYEFVAREGKVEVMFHIESGDYENVKRFIREKYEGNQTKLGNSKYKIEYKGRKYGRLVVYVPYRDGYENMAQCMYDLINLTKDEISGVLNGRT